MNKLLFILLSSVALSSASAIDLLGSYQKALQYNANYLKANAQGMQLAEAPALSRAALFPQINSTAGLSENYLQYSGLNVLYNQSTVGLQLNQVIFDWAKFSAVTKAKFSAKVGELLIADARQQLMLNVTQAYLAVLNAADNLLATQMAKSAYLKQVTQAKQAYYLGSVTITDVNDAQAAYDAAAAEEFQDRTTLIYKKNLFYNLTGVSADLIQPINKDIALQLPEPSEAEWWSQHSESNNLNIKIAQAQLAMARQDIKIAAAGHMPTIVFQAQYQYQGSGGIDDVNGTAAQIQSISAVPGSPLSSYTVAGAGLSLQIPIFSGGGISAQVRQASSIYESANQELNNIKRQTTQNTQNAYWQIHNGVSMVQAQQQALISTKAKLDADQKGYTVGTRNSVDLVMAQKEYYNAFRQYQNARYQYLYAQVQLQYLSSDINDDFVRKINASIRN